MIEHDHIDTINDLEAWLLAFPSDNWPFAKWRIFGLLSLRAGLRVLPAAWGNDWTRPWMLPVLRVCLAVDVAVTSGEERFAALANGAADEVMDELRASVEFMRRWEAEGDAVNVAVRTVVEAGFIPTELGIEAGAATGLVDLLDGEFDDAVRDDCRFLEQSDLPIGALWHDAANPFQQTWRELREKMQSSARSEEAARGLDPAGWNFWIDWYEAKLSGYSLDQKMLEEVATSEEIDWAASDQEVNGKINEIRQRHAREHTYNAERITQNAETGRLDVVVERPLSELRLSDVQAKMLEAASVFDGEGGENGPYGGLSSEVELIRQAAARKDPRSIGLYDACRRAAKRAMGKAARGECPQDDLVEDFAEQLTETAFDISGFDEDVRQVVANRATLKLEERVQADPAIAAEVLPGLAVEVDQVSEGDLQAEFAADAQIASDPDADARSRGNALYRLASRTFRIVQWLGKATAGTLKVLALVPGALAGIKLVVASPAFQAALRYLQSFF